MSNETSRPSVSSLIDELGYSPYAPEGLLETLEQLSEEFDNPQDEVIPGITPELLLSLEARFPPRCIQYGESPELAHRYAGMVELVQLLRQSFEEYSKPRD